MEHEQERQKLRDQYLVLDQLDAVLNRIQRYQKILSMQDGSKLTNQEKLWLLAYDGLNLKMKPGTEDSLLKVALLLPVFEIFIPQEIK